MTESIANGSSCSIPTKMNYSIPSDRGLNRARRPMALRPTLDKDLCMVHWDGLELPYCGCVYEKFWNGLALIRNIIQNYHFRPS